MMQFTMTGLTKSDTIFETVSKFHREESLHGNNMVNFKLCFSPTRLAGMVISFDTSLLNCVPYLTVSPSPTPAPAEMLFASHSWSFLSLPITRWMGTLPSCATGIATKLLFFRLIRLKSLSALLADFCNQCTSFRPKFAFHISSIGNTLTLTRTKLLSVMNGLETFIALLTDQVIEFAHSLSISVLDSQVKKYPDAPVLDKEDILIFRKAYNV